MAGDIVAGSARKLGVVYTPSEVAHSITRLVLGTVSGKLSILEPSVGDGAFLSAMFKLLRGQYAITAIDIDKTVVSALQEKYAESPVKVIASDFIKYSNKNYDLRYDLVIGNPPFIRKHDYSPEFKAEISLLSSAVAYPEKHLKNAWAAFIVAAERLLSSDGVLAFIVPYELMNVSYGQELQKLIFQKFERVDVYIPDEKAFKSIDQDAVAFVARKRRGKTRGGLFINRVKSLSNLASISSSKVVLGNGLDATRNFSLDLKSFLFDEPTIKLLARLRERCDVLSDFCQTSPGIVTAANDFFILSGKDVHAYQLEKYAVPILKKGSYLPKGPIFSNADFERLAIKEPCYFISLRGEDFESYSGNVLKYIEYGESLGLQNRYKCRKRKFWYEVPSSTPAAGFFFKRSHAFPRVCLNETTALVTDTAYQIKPFEGYLAKNICFSFYNSLTMLFAEIDGRFYGGGVLELTPNEFKGLPFLYHEASDQQFNEFVKTHYLDGDVGSLLASNGDVWLASRMGLSADEVAMLQSAWRKVRDHRLRHGSAMKDYLAPL